VDAVVYEVLLRRVVVVEGGEQVAAALRGAANTYGLLDGAARGEGVVRQVLRAAGADALRGGVLVCRGGVVPPLGASVAS
jgi:methylmalonyl-CoA mutase cobalamin-binding subunit